MNEPQEPSPPENEQRELSPPEPENKNLSRRERRSRDIQKVVKYAGLGGIGFGLPTTITLLFSGQVQAAAGVGLVTVGATFAAIAYRFISNTINKILDKIEEELENLEEPIANWTIEKSKTLLVKTWWRLNPRFQRDYYESLIDTFRELKVEGFRIGLPALDLEKVYISLRVEPKNLERIPKIMISLEQSLEGREIWEFLRQSTQKSFRGYRRLAIIGPPGLGKTTLLKHITLTYAHQNYTTYQAPKFIPILLYLRDIRHLVLAETPPTLPHLIRQHIEALPADPPLKIPPNWLEDQLRIGNCLVMFDGLDEVANAEERERVSQWVNRQMSVYRKTPFILTSRPHGYMSNPVEQVGTVLEVLPFTPQQTADFIISLYRQNEILRTGRETPAVLTEARNLADDLIRRLRENRAISDMASNPLLVTMIATVHYCGNALPGRRVELYQKICDLLLGARQQAKRMEIPLTAEQNKSVLQGLALALMRQETREFPLSEGIDIVREELRQVAGDGITPAEFFRQIKEVSGLLVERELGVYEFAHLSFQEYLAACEVKELQREDILLANFDNPWWSETIRLYAAQSDATGLIQYAIEHPTVTSLHLALTCQEESLKISPATRAELYRMLEAGLESPDRDLAKLAAEVKLLQRLKNLVKIENDLEIDLDYLTHAEYQLFVDDWLDSRHRFSSGMARIPVTRISHDDALNFCGWLTQKAVSLTRESQPIYCRLPTATESRNHPARESSQMNCQTMDGQGDNLGIRLVKTPNPCLFAFETVTVNSRGEILSRQRLARRFIRETISSPLHSEGVFLDMVPIPGGTFWMGTEDAEVERLCRKFNKEYFRAEQPRHEVTVSPFWMGKYPITQAQWRSIASCTDLKVNRDLDPDHSHFKGDDRPVESIDWYSAVEFCARLSRLTGEEYRLPTEAEWEYACRAGTTTPFYFGETITGELANYRATSVYADEPQGQYREETTPVGQFPPNAFGFYDMHGQVWEWCVDDWRNNYQGASVEGGNSRGNLILARSSLWRELRNWFSALSNRRFRGLKNSNDNRSQSTNVSLRGGSWYRSPHYCRSADRSNVPRVNYDTFIGFRVVRVSGRTL